MTRKPRTAREQKLLDTAARLLPAGVRGATASAAQALVVSEAKGSRIRDVSGNEYVDYLMGSGAIFTGHADPTVTAAVNAAAVVERNWRRGHFEIGSDMSAVSN